MHIPGKLLLLSLLLCRAVMAAETADLTEPAAVRDWLASALAEPLAPPSISVAVSVGGDLVLAEAAGFADLDEKRPATPETTYRSYSISKGVTTVEIE